MSATAADFVPGSVGKGAAAISAPTRSGGGANTGRRSGKGELGSRSRGGGGGGGGGAAGGGCQSSSPIETTVEEARARGRAKREAEQAVERQRRADIETARSGDKFKAKQEAARAARQAERDRQQTKRAGTAERSDTRAKAEAEDERKREVMSKAKAEGAARRAAAAKLEEQRKSEQIAQKEMVRKRKENQAAARAKQQAIEDERRRVGQLKARAMASKHDQKESVAAATGNAAAGSKSDTEAQARRKAEADERQRSERFTEAKRLGEERRAKAKVSTVPTAPFPPSLPHLINSAQLHLLQAEEEARRAARLLERQNREEERLAARKRAEEEAEKRKTEMKAEAIAKGEARRKQAKEEEDRQRALAAKSAKGRAEREAAELTAVSAADSGPGKGAYASGCPDELPAPPVAAAPIAVPVGGGSARSTPNRRSTMERFVARGGGSGSEGSNHQVTSRYGVSLAGVEQFQTRNELDDASYRDRQRVREQAQRQRDTQMLPVNHFTSPGDVAGNSWQQPAMMRPEPQGGSGGFHQDSGGGSYTATDAAGAGSATVAAVKSATTANRIIGNSLGRGVGSHVRVAAKAQREAAREIEDAQRAPEKLTERGVRDDGDADGGWGDDDPGEAPALASTAPLWAANSKADADTPATTWGTSPEQRGREEGAAELRPLTEAKRTVCVGSTKTPPVSPPRSGVRIAGLPKSRGVAPPPSVPFNWADEEDEAGGV